MRILITTDTVGGVWIYTQELAAGLLQRGCAVFLMSLGRAPSAWQQAWCDQMCREHPSAFEYAATDVPLEWMQDNQRAYSAAAPLLERIVERFQPDILHLNQFCFGALPVDAPKVVVAHSDVLSWAEARRGGPLEDSAWLRQYRALVEQGLANADAVVAPTRWMLNALARNFALPRGSCVIRNGRSLAVTSEQPRKLQAVTAGRLWDEAKNVALLGDVRSPVPLLVAGEDKREATRTPPQNLRLLGTMSPEELHAVFRQSAIYICTSRYEPFGLAPLEAALCGCAVLANDIPSLREVWGEGALYFGDAPSLTALLDQLCGNPAQLQRTRERSWERAQWFTADRMVESYLELFTATLARPGEPVYV